MSPGEWFYAVAALAVAFLCGHYLGWRAAFAEIDRRYRENPGQLPFRTKERSEP